ncbi:BON domain-containing protein [Pistricoccus aurantiacus]|uniref:BON domain-containing protein n=1 Tax=Pistricoccus aurantiacus TaxID=1883414 RepID=UPI00363FB057
MHANKVVKTLAFCCSLLILSGCASTYQEAERTPRREAILETRVKTALLETPELGAAAIIVRKQGKGVVLTGFVESEDKKDQAEKIAAGVEGVQRVDNQLEVKY